MKVVLLGNAIALVGAALMVGVGLLKERRQILTAQCVMYGAYAVSNFVLGGISGAISSLVSLARNLLCFKWELTLGIRLAFAALQTALTALVNTQGLLGWLPVLATVSLTLFINEKDEIKLKLVIIFGLLCWVVYDWAILSYVSFLFDLAAVGSNLLGIRAIRQKRKAEKAL